MLLLVTSSDLCFVFTRKFFCGFLNKVFCFPHTNQILVKHLCQEVSMYDVSCYGVIPQLKVGFQSAVHTSKLFQKAILVFVNLGERKESWNALLERSFKPNFPVFRNFAVCRVVNSYRHFDVSQFIRCISDCFSIDTAQDPRRPESSETLLSESQHFAIL